MLSTKIKPIDGSNADGELILPANKNIDDLKQTQPVLSDLNNAPKSGLMATSQQAMQQPVQKVAASPYAAKPGQDVNAATSTLPTRYEAQDGKVDSASLVENRLQGLMSTDNPLMKKSIINANNLSAQRGLQSSSIATENAINSMYNYALPIAQQDAGTVSQQNLANQANKQQVGIQDNQAINQQVLNDVQNRFTATESQVQRQFTAELEAIKNQNQQGLLDQQGQIRLQELEYQNELAITQLNKSAEIQSSRDQLLQTFQNDNMATELANQIITIETQARENSLIQDSQNNFARQMEYSNAVSSAANFGIEALGNAFLNPEITPSQYANIQDNILSMVNAQIKNFQDIYDVTDTQTDQQADNTTPITGPDVGVIGGGSITNPGENYIQGGGGGGGSGGSNPILSSNPVQIMR